DRDRWATHVHPFSEVVYPEIYPGVDFEISGQDAIKYQWVIKKPTTDNINKIKIQVNGASSIEIVEKKLVIKTSCGDLVDDVPFAYQIIDNEIIAIEASYRLSGTVVTYAIEGKINESHPLIIDPKLIFSTYSGSVGDNFGYTATYDSRGNLYAGGIVDTRGPYPVTSGAIDQSWNGGTGSAPAGLACDVAISKYDSAGSKLLWATYLGGEKDEYPHSLVADKNDNLLILGTTYSTDYPFTLTGYDTSHAGQTDIYVSKISPDGTILIGSTFIGGNLRDGLTLNLTNQYQTEDLKYNYSDDYRGDIITDENGNIFVATTARSKNLPLVNETQSTNKGSLDGYIFELSPDCSKLNWATYLGGVKQDAFYSIKLDRFNRIIVGGGTASTDLPSSDSIYAKDNKGDVDGVIAVFDKTSKVLKGLTYWGTTSYDQIYFIDTDIQGRIYATGQSEGNIQKTNDTYGESGKGQFIFRIDSSLKTIDLQTTFGNTIQKPNLTPSAFLVDVCEHVYFSGWGSNVDPSFHPGNTLNMPITIDAEQKTTDGNDFYVIVFDKDVQGLLYSTYFGGDVTDDHVDGGTSRFDKKGVIYQSVCSSCPPSNDGQNSQVSDFPTSSGAAFETNPSVRCSNASFKIDLQIKTAVIADFIPSPTRGCGPLEVKFTNYSVLGDSLIWDFGDGTTSDEIHPVHIFDEPGIYTITLTVIDSNTCNVSSEYKRKIEVVAQAIADFEVSFNGCENELTIENKSKNGFDFTWDFGDGDSSSQENPEHEYSTAGDFTISLFVNKGTLCEDEHVENVSVTEKAIPELFLYNVFTPNEDGINDCFQFDGKLLDCQDFKWKIYNRWGEQIFKTEDPYSCWNGRVNNQGNLVPEGTYFYLLWYGDKSTTPISGQVQVVY
ncbi:MAG: PKD domain-containing protein, partial [Bacteroidia bacterium]